MIMSNLFVNHILPAEFEDLAKYLNNVRVDNLFLYAPNDFYERVDENNERDKERMKRCVETFLIKYMKKPPVYWTKHTVKETTKEINKNYEMDKKREQIEKLKLDDIDDEDLDDFLNNIE